MRHAGLWLRGDILWVFWTRRAAAMSAEESHSTPRSGVSLATKLYYGFGSVAYGVKDNGFAYLLLLFYNQVLGLPAAVGGRGHHDRADRRRDHRPDRRLRVGQPPLAAGAAHPFMYASAIPVALWPTSSSGTRPPDLSREARALRLLLPNRRRPCVRIFITFYEIPSTSLVAELTEDYDERTSMLAFRFFFGWWGGLSMAVLAYLVFLPQDQGRRPNISEWLRDLRPGRGGGSWSSPS